MFNTTDGTNQSTNFSTQLRRAVNTSGMSWYRIAKEVGVAESSISRFMNGKGGLSMNVLDRMWAVLGLHITQGDSTHG